MSYFKNFPLVRYGDKLLVNLTRRAGISQRYKSNPAYYMEHNVVEGDTPENLADRFYDNAELAWIILSFNDILNVFEEWPKNQAELDSYIAEKYENPYAINHHVSASSGAVIDPNFHPAYDRIPVTNYEHETDLNDAKRKIKLLLPEYVSPVVAMHKEMMRKGI